LLKEFFDSVLLYLLFTLVSLLFGFGIAYLKAKLANERLITVKSLALDAVKYAQATNSSFSGIIRWGVASDWLERQVNKRGIKANQEELNGLIESALKELKIIAGDKWKDAIITPTIEKEDYPKELPDSEGVIQDQSEEG
jgi:hypothetical protein